MVNHDLAQYQPTCPNMAKNNSHPGPTSSMSHEYRVTYHEESHPKGGGSVSGPSTSSNIKGGGAKGDWDFQISDLVKNPGGTDI